MLVRLFGQLTRAVRRGRVPDELGAKTALPRV